MWRTSRKVSLRSLKASGMTPRSLSLNRPSVSNRWARDSVRTWRMSAADGISSSGVLPPLKRGTSSVKAGLAPAMRRSVAKSSSVIPNVHELPGDMGAAEAGAPAEEFLRVLFDLDLVEQTERPGAVKLQGCNDVFDCAHESLGKAE